MHIAQSMQVRSPFALEISPGQHRFLTRCVTFVLDVMQWRVRVRWLWNTRALIRRVVLLRLRWLLVLHAPASRCRSRRHAVVFLPFAFPFACVTHLLVPVLRSAWTTTKATMPSASSTLMYVLLSAFFCLSFLDLSPYVNVNARMRRCCPTARPTPSSHKLLSCCAARTSLPLCGLHSIHFIAHSI